MKRRKETCRKVFAAALAVALAGSCLGYGSIGTETAQAADSEGTVTVEGSSVTVVPDASALADNDELFAGYAEDIFYGSSEMELLSSDYASNVLDDFNYQVYSELKAGVSDIADGTVASTVMVLSDDTTASLSWTFSELGFENVSTQAELNAIVSELTSAMNEKCNSMMDIDLILQCLMADCPYELYWFDKTQGISCTWNMAANGSSVWITDMTFTFYVEPSYRDGAYNKVNASKVNTAKAAAAYAAEIVQNYASATDTEKLEAYKDEICSLVSYNESAAAGGSTYDDPWELVYVFDQDEDTNVVCEGYSKAFQYLCELSDFSGDVSCYSVSGTMAGGTGAGAHMWNIVVMDGVNYLVDVTDSDEGTIGQNGELFLATADDATGYTPGEAYTFTIRGNEINYTYDDDTIALYGSDILTLGSTVVHADTLALRRNSTFFISYTLGGGTDLSFTFGKASDEILVGDWDGDGLDTICLRRGNIYYFSNTLGGTTDYYIKFGKDTDEVLVGDWDG
ncbi:MAG: hypothetical protein LUF32_02980, partial [Clostridiales bacterium]|nr:hypothetical protein [Clostridiales bacterium]